MASLKTGVGKVKFPKTGMQKSWERPIYMREKGEVALQTLCSNTAMVMNNRNYCPVLSGWPHAVDKIPFKDRYRPKQKFTINFSPRIYRQRQQRQHSQWIAQVPLPSRSFAAGFCQKRRGEINTYDTGKLYWMKDDNFPWPFEATLTSKITPFKLSSLLRRRITSLQ